MRGVGVYTSGYTFDEGIVGGINIYGHNYRTIQYID